MIKTVSLTEDQKDLLRKAISRQMQSLEKIFNEDGANDLTLYSIVNGVPKEYIKTNAREYWELFKAVYDTPENIFSLSGDDLGIIKHILFNFYLYEEAFPSTWAKFCTFDKLSYTLN